MQETDSLAHPPSPQISIVTGIFNSMPYLEHYLRMLTQQTFRDWEAILVDDGSSDGSCEFIEQARIKDSRLKLIRKKPEGYPSRSRAVGLAAARAPYVAFCDHDDFWAPQKLELQLYVLRKQPNIAILHTDRIVWRDLRAPAELYQYTGSLAAVPVRQQRAEEVIYKGLQIIFSSFIGHRPMIQTVGFHPGMKGVDDFYLFVRLAQMGDICRIDLPLTYYYAHASNLSHTRNIFVDGFYQVHAALLQDSVPQKARDSLLAQACRTEAVSLMASDRRRAMGLLLKSLTTYFIPSTLTRLLFLSATYFVPMPLQTRIMRLVKIVKFKLPTFRDVARRGTSQ